MLLVAAAMVWLVTPARGLAQFGFPPPQPPVNPRAIAPLDLARTVPMDATAYKFDIVLRGREQTPLDNNEH